MMSHIGREGGRAERGEERRGERARERGVEVEKKKTACVVEKKKRSKKKPTPNSRLRPLLVRLALDRIAE